jgi:hypothetical protein
MKAQDPDANFERLIRQEISAGTNVKNRLALSHRQWDAGVAVKWLYLKWEAYAYCIGRLTCS